MENETVLFQRAEAVLAGGFQTLSKNSNRYPLGIAPKFIHSGRGAYCQDLAGRSYIDLVAGLGPILFGHRDAAVDNAVRDQMDQGVTFSLGNPLEVEVAELLVGLIPSAEMVRFGKNGADVTNAAVRLARHVTGRSHVIFCGYHGGHDSYIATTDNRGGVLTELMIYNHQIRWGNYEQLYKVVRDVTACYPNARQGLAAIMAEVPPPIYGDSLCEEEYTRFLQELRTLATRNGAVFILDEVVTGFRKHPGGAQSHYLVTPDLSCFSKAMGNGYSVSALVGLRELMRYFEDGEVFMSTTFGGEAIGLAAASVVISAIGYTRAWEHLKEMGDLLGDGLYGLIHNYHIPALLTGDHSRMLIKFSDVDEVASSNELKTFWQQEMIKLGILAGGPIFPMVCYDEHIVNTILSAAAVTFEKMNWAIIAGTIRELLECPVITDVFAKRYQTSDQKAKMVW